MNGSLEPRRLIAFAALAVIVFGLCYGAAAFFTGSTAVAAIWPANALVLAFKLRACPTRTSARVALGVAFAAMVAANLAVGRPLASSLGFSAANVVEIMVAAWFLRRIPMPMADMRSLGRFLIGAVVAAPLSSTLLAGAVMAGSLGLRGETLLEAAGGWLLADVMGMAIVAPFALSLGSVARRGWLRALTVPLAIGLLVFILCFQSVAPVLLLSFPLTALAVFHDRDRGGALTVGAITLAVVASAPLGEGPVVRAVQLGLDPVAMIQIFLGALVLTAYPIAVTLKKLDLYAARLDDRRQAAEADSAAKSRVLGQVGEDLRSPLTGVVTVAEMLRSGRLGALNERQRELLARISESGAEIEAMSREMMAAADGGALHRPSSAVAEAVAGAVAAARFQARRARVSIDVLAGDPEWRVAVDAARLGRLVSDGLSAALDAALPDTRLRVLVGLDADQTVTVTIEDSAAHRLNARLKAFETATRDGAGMPLGADRADLRARGGDISLSPGALGGAQYRLTLPRHDPAQEIAA